MSTAAQQVAVPLVLGAPTRRELGALADSVAAAGTGAAGLRALGRDLAARADPAHRFRTVLFARSAAEVAAAPTAAATCVPRPEPGPLAFLFAGQSSQRLGMGEQLGREFAVLEQLLGQVCAHADPRLPAPLRAVIAGAVPPEWDQPVAPIDSSDFAQPALLAFGLGLVRLLATAGITPDLVAGHSFGEYVAAASAGVWSVPDACAVVTERGRLIGTLPPGGGMIAIEATEQEVARSLTGSVVISAVHGPASVAIAGPLGQIDTVARRFAEQGARTTRLGVANAYHSPAMSPVLDPLAAAISAVPARPMPVPLVGNATGTLVPPGDPATPAHWTRHCVLPVRWSDVMDTLRAQGTGTYLEIGPSGVLGKLAAGCLDPAERDAVVPAVLAEPDEVSALLTALARLDARGYPVDWAAVFAASASLRG